MLKAVAEGLSFVIASREVDAIIDPFSLERDIVDANTYDFLVRGFYLF